MGAFKDLTGQKFYMLLVLELAERRNGHLYWKCLCDCGNITCVLGSNLTKGHTRSCGCFLENTRGNASITHGMSKTRLYAIWNGIKKRCYNSNFENYNYYGGRGIKVCDEWKDSFEAFSSWTIKNGYTDKLTIERIDINKNYCPENCKWITQTEQAKNRSSSKYYTYNGKTQTLTDWCNELGLYYKTIHKRINNFGWSFERAISEPLHFQSPFKKG